MKNLNAPDYEVSTGNKPGKNENEKRWDENHQAISNFITQQLAEFGTMPGKSLIARATGLSRETVYKHLRDYDEQPISENDMNGFDLMTERVIAQVLKAALLGDLKAAKLFLETSEKWNNDKVIRRYEQQLDANFGVE